MKRIDIGDQVTTHSIRVDQFYNARFFVRLVACADRHLKERISIDVPPQRCPPDAQIQKDVVAKIMLANEQSCTRARNLPTQRPE